MSRNINVTKIDAANIAAEAKVASAAQDLVVVDVSPKTQKSKVVREGYQVPSPKVDVTKTDFFLDQLEVVPPRQAPRVVSQSIRPGTRVTPGTVVDLILALTDDVPFDIFENPHRDLKGKALATVTDGVLGDPKVRELMLKYERAEDVPEADKNFLITEFGKRNIRVTDETEDSKFESAFNSVQGALAFK